MAGVKGKSGGARPGAGRKPAAPILSESPSLLTKDSMAFLVAVMNDVETDMKVRTDAAKALLAFQHRKPGEAGKKDERAEAAKRVSGGKFAAAAPPKLVVNNR